MTAGEQAVVDAFALEDLARVARHLRAIDAASRPVRRRASRPATGVPAGVEGHDGHVWWAAGPDVASVALALEARAQRPVDRRCWGGTPERPLPSPAGHGPVRLAVVDPDERKLRLARMVVATGDPWRGGDDVWFVPGGLLAGAAGDAGAPGGVAFLYPAGAPPVTAGPAAYQLLALARWMGVEAAGAALVDAALRWLGAAPDLTGGAGGAPAADLHDRGARVFVDLGAGPTDLAAGPTRALAGRDHVAVPALPTGPAPLARLDRTLTALWAEGAGVLPDALHRPPPSGPAPTVGQWPAGEGALRPTPRYQGEA